MKSFLHNNNIETYSTHSKGKSVAAESFIRTFKNKIYKYMTIDKLDDIVNKHRTGFIS